MARQQLSDKQTIVVMSLFGIIFLIVGTLGAIYTYPEGDTQFIKGIVTGTGSCSKSSKGSTTCHGEFKYSMNGIEYEGSTGYSTTSTWHRGETITVIANRDNPKDYTTLNDIMFFMIFAVAGLSVILAPAIYMLIKRKKNCQLETNDYNLNNIQNNGWN